MATRNDITGDTIQSKVASKAYLNNFDEIFRKKQDDSQLEMQELKEEHVDLLKGYHWQDKDVLKQIVKNWSSHEFLNNGTTQAFVKQAKERLGYESN